MKRSIDIFTTVGDGSIEYSALLRESMLRFTSGKFDLRFKCLSNAEADASGWVTVMKQRSWADICSFKASGSYIHGLMLNEISKFIDADMFIIADADTAVISPNWDDSLSELLGGKISITGAASSRKNSRYRNFPCAIFMMGITSVFLKVKPNFLPALDKSPKRSLLKKKIRNDSESRLWGLPRRASFNCDTGWELPQSYNDHGARGSFVEHEDNLNRKPIHSEFESWYLKDTPIISHAGGSRTKNVDKYKAWENFVRKKIDA